MNCPMCGGDGGCGNHSCEMCEGTGEAPVCARCGVVFNAVSAALARTIAKARATIVGYECPLYCVECEAADRDDSLREHLYGERDAEQDEE